MQVKRLGIIDEFDFKFERKKKAKCNMQAASWVRSNHLRVTMQGGDFQRGISKMKKKGVAMWSESNEA